VLLAVDVMVHCGECYKENQAARYPVSLHVLVSFTAPQGVEMARMGAR
jgi:hypothetical protein